MGEEGYCPEAEHAASEAGGRDGGQSLGWRDVGYMAWRWHSEGALYCAEEGGDMCLQMFIASGGWSIVTLLVIHRHINELLEARLESGVSNFFRSNLATLSELCRERTRRLA